MPPRGVGQRQILGRCLELDVLATYVLHVFTGGVDEIQGLGRLEQLGALSRQSSHARAVYSAVWDAVTVGITPLEEGDAVKERR